MFDNCNNLKDLPDIDFDLNDFDSNDIPFRPKITLNEIFSGDVNVKDIKLKEGFFVNRTGNLLTVPTGFEVL